MKSLQRRLQELEQLGQEVKVMRSLQKRYYRTFDKVTDLPRAKAQERKIDGMLANLYGGTTLTGKQVFDLD